MDKAGRTQPNLYKGCRGRGGFEVARDAITLSLRTTDLDTETRRVSTMSCKCIWYFPLCKIGPLSLVWEPIVLDLRTSDFGLEILV
jgi:hypothetical protein